MSVMAPVRAADTWIECADLRAWDALAASVSTHPLQSALWGEARRAADGTDQLLLQSRGTDGELLGLARIEVRRAAMLRFAWMPRGPWIAGAREQALRAALDDILREKGFAAAFSTEYRAAPSPEGPGPLTVWVDLSGGPAAVKAALHSGFRNSIGRAARLGVTVRTTTEPDDVSRFHALCEQVSQAKRFDLPGSEALMQHLVAHGEPGAPVAAALYLAEAAGELACGALVLRCGRHAHYMWGAAARRTGNSSAGQALHWRIIDDMIAQGVTRYDLEGIDPVGNPGVYEFKRGFGGQTVRLPALRAQGLSLAGRAAVSAARLAGRVQ
jgi:CelD/BcsL family acetyltransferase involved in cellulose biosynthesis